MTASVARVFISYRSSDGRDKATALARDLGQRFGDAQIFLDKDDLRGGSLWRDEVARTLGQQPVLLLLLTPELLGAADAAGHHRIDAPDDPVRRELAAALASGAQVIPVLCDGVEAPPDAATLPPPFNRLAEFTWRRLRAYDWANDVQRLADDLVALGVPTQLPPPMPVATGAPKRQRRGLLLTAGVAVGVLAVGAAAIRWRGKPAADGLSGEWQATLVRGEQVSVTLAMNGDVLSLFSAPMVISARPEWAEYRGFWRERFKSDLDAVSYRAEGRLVRDPGRPLRIDLALHVLAVPSDEPVDSGNLSATLSADGRRLDGKIWLNSAQADWPASLLRGPR